GEPRRTASDDAQVDIGRQRNIAHVNLENVFATRDIGIRHHYLTIEAARTQKRGIKDVGAVGSRDQDDTLIGFEAVHLNQQLVKCLLAFIVPASKSSTTLAAYRVNFIDENDARFVLLCLLEHVADTGSANT